MKTTQEVLDRLKFINEELQLTINLPHWNYKRRMLLKEYNVLHWVLF